MSVADDLAELRSAEADTRAEMLGMIRALIGAYKRAQTDLAEKSAQLEDAERRIDEFESELHVLRFGLGEPVEDIH